MATKMDIGEIITFEDMITETDLTDLMDSTPDSLRPARTRPAGVGTTYFLVGSSCIICKNGK